MLQRAASNAYSWWWASHIRTKQSKWLEQSLQDMEEKVQGMLKLIEEDGDSFVKRAEMYYKRRPELISTIEESFKSFRALADRYDHLSKELQNANNTLASVCPEQMPYMDDDDDETPRPKFPRNVPTANAANIPKAPTKDLKGLLTTASKQVKAKKSEKPQSHNKVVQKSGLTKDEALKEIDKLQKDILVMQTAKEYVKSSYESGVAKYWEIENQITEMQQKVCMLRDEFNVDSVIEDDEARTLMAEAALKSCQETLAQLQEKQEISAKDAREEYKIEDACQRIKSLKSKFLPNQMDEEKTTQDDKIANRDGSESSEVEKSEVKFNSIPSGPLTVTELAEKIDELVTTVIGLEGAMSSQTILIKTLTTESDELHSQIRNLENEKDTLIGDTQSLSSRIKEMEEKLANIQELNKNVESQTSSLQAEFAGARSGLNHLTEKLGSVKPDEEPEAEDTYSDDTAFSSLEGKSLDEDFESLKYVPLSAGDVSSSLETEEKVDVKELFVNVVKEAAMNVESSELSVPEKKEEPETTPKKSVTILEQKLEEKVPVDHLKDPITPGVQGGKAKAEELNWQQMLLTGEDDREKILLKEYTEILRNFKDVKKKLSDMEKKDRDSQFDITLQLSEQKKAILKKDEVIQRLREKLNSKRDNKGDDMAVDDDLEVNETFDASTADKFDEMNSLFVNNNTTASVSIVEEKLRMEIDAILDENLDFWLRFSTAFHQIQKFRTEVQDLQHEITKLKEKKKQEGSASGGIKSELRPIYKHLREIQAELTVWLERSVSLKDELKGRFASLCSIQEEITKALKEGVEEDEIRFSSHQAAKFQGEILNMKQENNKVREELNAGLDHVSVLQLEIGKTLKKLSDEFGIYGDQSDSKNQPKVPLRSFIFGTKPKNKKNSIFSCMHPNKRFQVLKSGVPMPNNLK